MSEGSASQTQPMSSPERDSHGRFSRVTSVDAIKTPGKKPDLSPERTPRAIDNTTDGGRRELGWIAENPSTAQVDKVVEHLLEVGAADTLVDALDGANNYFERARGWQSELDATEAAIRENRAQAFRAKPGSAEAVLLDSDRRDLMNHRRNVKADINSDVAFARKAGLQVEPEQDQKGKSLGEKASKAAANAGWYGAAGAQKAGEAGREFGKGFQRGREKGSAALDAASQKIDRAGRVAGRGAVGAGRAVWNAPGRANQAVDRGIGRVAYAAGREGARFVSGVAERGGRAAEDAARRAERTAESLRGGLDRRVQGGLSFIRKAGERLDKVFDSWAPKVQGAPEAVSKGLKKGAEFAKAGVDKFGRPVWDAAAAWAEQQGIREKLGKATDKVDVLATGLGRNIEAGAGKLGSFFRGMAEKGKKIADSLSEPDKKVIAAVNRVGGWIDGASDAVQDRVAREWKRLADGPFKSVSEAASRRVEKSKSTYKDSEAGMLRQLTILMEVANDKCEPVVDRIKDEGRIWRNRAVGLADGVEQATRGTLRKFSAGVESRATKFGRDIELNLEAFGDTAAGQLLKEGAEHMRLWGNDARTGLNQMMDAVGAGGGRFKKLVESAKGRLTRKSETTARTPGERATIVDFVKEAYGGVTEAMANAREYISRRLVRKAEQSGMTPKEANGFMKFVGAGWATGTRAAENALGGTIVNGERMVDFVGKHKKGAVIALGVGVAAATLAHPDAGRWLAEKVGETFNAIGQAGANAVDGLGNAGSAVQSGLNGLNETRGAAVVAGADALGDAARAVQEGVSGLTGGGGIVGNPDVQGVSSVAEAANLGGNGSPDLANVGAGVAEAVDGVRTAAEGLVDTAQAAAASPEVAQAVNAAVEAVSNPAVPEAIMTKAQEIAANLPVGQAGGIWNQVQGFLKEVPDPAQRLALEMQTYIAYAKANSDNILSTSQYIIDNAPNYRGGEVALAQAEKAAMQAILDGKAVTMDQAMDAVRYLNPSFK